MLSLALLASSLLYADTYTDEATFQAQLGTSITDNYTNSGYVFSQTDANMTAVLNETHYQSTEFPNNDLVFSGGGYEYYCAGCNGSFLLSFSQTTVGNSNGVFGVGLDLFNSSSPLYDAFVTFGNGTTADYVLPSNSDLSTLTFWGITSSAEIESIYFGIDGGPTGGQSFAITNLTIGEAAAPVPEPTSLLLLATVVGLVGFLTGRRRLATRR